MSSSSSRSSSWSIISFFPSRHAIPFFVARAYRDSEIANFFFVFSFTVRMFGHPPAHHTPHSHHISPSSLVPFVEHGTLQSVTFLHLHSASASTTLCCCCSCCCLFSPICLVRPSTFFLLFLPSVFTYAHPGRRKNVRFWWSRRNNVYSTFFPRPASCDDVHMYTVYKYVYVWLCTCT